MNLILFEREFKPKQLLYAILGEIFNFVYLAKI